VNTLITGASEVEQATADFTADGKSYKQGSYIVKLAQPYGAFAKSILEIQNYPNIPEYPGGPLQRPYDVTAQTMPLLLGVTAIPVRNQFEAPLQPVTRATVAPGSFTSQRGARGYTFQDESNSSLYALFALLQRGLRAYRIAGAGQQPDTIYLPQQKDLEAALASVAGRLPVQINAVADLPKGPAMEVHLPRIALYQSWVPSMDEGWTRWIFDQNQIPYTLVVDADIRNGSLNQRFDVIVLPDNAPSAITSGRYGRGEESEGPQVPPEFRGGLGQAGLASLHAFAEAGGTLVALNKASLVYTAKDTPVTNALDGVAAKDFYIPGSILQVAVDTSNPLAFGSKANVPIFFEQSPSFHVSGDAQSVAYYDSDKPLLSGWILGGQYLRGTSALANEPVGKGHVILFGFRPQYRAQSEVTYRFFFNALLYSTSQPAVLGQEAAKAGASEHKHGKRG
jgi:hypothetical protein